MSFGAKKTIKVGDRLIPYLKQRESSIMGTPKTNMTMENPPVKDVFPIENGDFSNVILDFRGVYINPPRADDSHPLFYMEVMGV